MKIERKISHVVLHEMLAFSELFAHFQVCFTLAKYETVSVLNKLSEAISLVFG